MSKDDYYVEFNGVPIEKVIEHLELLKFSDVSEGLYTDFLAEIWGYEKYAELVGYDNQIKEITRKLFIAHCPKDKERRLELNNRIEGFWDRLCKGEFSLERYVELVANNLVSRANRERLKKNYDAFVSPVMNTIKNTFYPYFLKIIGDQIAIKSEMKINEIRKSIA